MATGPTQTRDDDPDAPEWWRRTAPLKRASLILVVVLGAIIIHAAQGGKAPSITKSCTTPDFALSSYKSARHHEIEYSVTGPPGMPYLLMVGVSGFVSANHELIATPDIGHTKEQMQAASQRKLMEADCVQTGRFGVLVPNGTYAVRLFRLEGPSGNVQAVDVASHQLVVTS
jgi:hypothetical protein